MLPKEQRLTTKDLEKVLKEGRIYHSPLFQMRIGKNENDLASTSRVSAIVPAKMIKTAAGRSVVRRKIYNASRSVMKKTEPGWRIALIAKNPAIDAPQESVSEELKSLFVKAGIIK